MIIYANVPNRRTWMMDVRNKSDPFVPQALTGSIRLVTADPGRTVIAVRSPDSMDWSLVELDRKEALALIDGLKKLLKRQEEEESE